MKPNLNFLKIKSNLFFILCSLLIIFSYSVLADQPLSAPNPTSETSFQQDEKEFKDASLSTSAGITPDSPLYFLDTFFDNFADDATNREEKIAEIKAMVQAGKVDQAKIARDRYQQFAKRTEKDISPEQQQQARKSAVAISHVMNEIKNDIPKEKQQEFEQEFVKDIISQEEKISTAAKVADKIKTLCETLSKLDPQQYAQTCKVKDNEQAPQWQRSLDDKLTVEQQQEARAFFKTMSNCMRNPATCQCDEITIKPFAEKCKLIAPVAAKCNQGDKSACDAMDKDTENIEDLLPPHLQSVMKDMDKELSGAKFENHMPQECQKANIDPKSSNAREQCEEIMFKQNAPEECVKAGVKDHKECGKIMFNLKAPPECKDAGLTGELQSDPHQCEKIMQDLHSKEEQEQQNNNQDPNNKFNRGPPGGSIGQPFGKNCKDIADLNEKLHCLEEFYNQAQQQQNNQQPPPPENQQDQSQQNQYPQSKYPQSQYPPNENNNPNNNYKNNYPNNYPNNNFQNNNFDPFRAPPECHNTKSPDECRKIMDEKSRKYQQDNENKYRSENKESGNQEYNPNFHGNAINPSQDQSQQKYQQQSPKQPCDCRNMQCNSGYPACDQGSTSCTCRSFDNQQKPSPQPQPEMEQPNVVPPQKQPLPPIESQPPPPQSLPPQEQNSPSPLPSSSEPSESSQPKESTPS